MTTAIVMTTTSDNLHQLNEISQRLLTERLAACCQIIGPHTSIYRWQDAIETSTEWMCLIKTRRDHFSKIEKVIRELHSYEVPEIIATNIVEGSEAYLNWLNEETG